MGRNHKHPDAIFHAEHRAALDALTLSERGEVLTAMMSFFAGEEIQELSPAAALAFSFLKVTAQYDIERYENKRKKASEAGKESARRRWSEEEHAENATDVNERQQTLTNVNERQHIVTQGNENNQEKEKEKEEEKEYTPLRGYTERGEAAKPDGEIPSLEQVTAYAESIGEADTAPQFFRVLTANKWKDGHGEPIQNWQSFFREWTRREKLRENERPQRAASPDTLPDIDAELFEKIRKARTTL